jgi:WD40 repeat protein
MRYVKGDVEIWNAATAQREAAFRAHDKRTTSASYIPDGQLLITGSLDGTLKWWNASTRELAAAISPGVGEITELKVTGDGRFLTVLSHEALSEVRKITSWDLATQKLRWGPKEFLADRMTFSPDGRMLATARKTDRFVTLWKLETGETKSVLRESGDQKSGLLRNVLSMAFSHDGLTLAVDDMSGLVSLWDIEMGEVRTKFQRLGGRIFGMSFSRDDRFLATGQQDDTVRIWEVSSAKPVAAFAGPARTQVRDITFASDGRTLLTRGIRLATEEHPRDGILQLWDFPVPLTPTKTR